MHKPRLRRLDWTFARYPAFFLTACTSERKPILACEAAHAGFVQFSEKASLAGIAVGRYVVMPDHLHLFAAFAPDSPSLSVWMKSLKNSLSRTLRQIGVAAPHWQKAFFDHHLRSWESYARQWEYVRQNPVRAGLVSHADDWPFQGEIHPLLPASDPKGAPSAPKTRRSLTRRS